jgi:hypothetical protein
MMAMSAKLKTAEGEQRQPVPLTLARLDAWVAAAKPGASLMLGIGAHAQQAMSRAVQERVVALAEAGLVHPVQRRCAGEARMLAYQIQRSSRRLPVIWPKLHAFAPRVVPIGPGRTAR